MKKSVFLLGILLFWQHLCLALGLGNIELHSRLGDRLNASIPLTGMGDWQPDDIKVSLADKATYTKMGVDYLADHQKLAFEIRLNKQKEATLYISSTESIREPFLNFVIEVNYPQGKMIKDISLLLDTPSALTE